MITIFNAIRHYLFLVILVSAWVFPLFEVNIYDNFGNKKRTSYLGLAVMMLVKIFRPNSQVRERIEHGNKRTSVGPPIS